MRCDVLSPYKLIDVLFALTRLLTQRSIMLSVGYSLFVLYERL